MLHKNRDQIIQNMKIILVTTDNHTLGIQTISNIIYKKTGILPVMFYLPLNLLIYPPRIKTKILEYIIEEIDSVEETVLIGFQLKELSLKRSIQLARDLKQHRGNKIKLVAGGTYATFSPQTLLDTFDYVVVGSGSGILLVVDAVSRGDDIYPIVQATPSDYEYPLFTDSWILDSSGEIIKGRLRRLVHSQYRNTNALEFMTGIGCSYSCSYCEISSLRVLFGNKYKVSYSDPKKVAEMICNEKTLNPNINYIYFFDEDYLLKPISWIETFAHLYKMSIDIPFFIFATPISILKYPDKLDILSEAGLDTVNMGVQSGSEYITKRLLGRRENKDDVRKCVQVLTDLYLDGSTSSPPMLDFIILNPYETPNNLLETIDLIQSLPTPFNAIMHCMSFFRGTQLFGKAKCDGVISQDYELRYDLRDFMSRVVRNTLGLNYSMERPLQWLFLNTLMFGMNGMHQNVNGVRYLGSLASNRLNELKRLVNVLSYNDIISLAESFPNPINEAQIPWERTYQ